ncbi:MAG: hypothetical protein M1818_005557 [Claussenomyces sp. TS43310]|nr:MAG: hypothetical protein M1818_005557 [Claussenomyces sp. TS43310]
MVPRVSRRPGFYLVLFAVGVLYFSFSRFTWQDLPLERIGLGEHRLTSGASARPGATILEDLESSESNSTVQDNLDTSPKKEGVSHNEIDFHPGKTKPVGSAYSKTLIMPRTSEEDVDWVYESFPKGSGTDTKIYTVDDVSQPLHPPKNKGHEVMVYLTYIIDHYDDALADVNVFLHSHRYAWHNNDILGSDAVDMLRRLSAERVQREGYMNLRCNWEPGCPDWMHPGTVKEDINKQEEQMLAKSWVQLFPLDPVPSVLAQPCCAQFAVSADRIRTLPKARYVFYRDWLLRTPLSDYISGRVWEYLWQYVFTGQNVVCPETHICYCDGYGICFGGKEEYETWWQKSMDIAHYDEELRQWHEDDDAIKNAQGEGRVDENKELQIPEYGRDVELEQILDELNEWVSFEKRKAQERGDIAMNRAKEAGRPWRDGDGF